jgi:hypothetical protein
MHRAPLVVTIVLLTIPTLLPAEVAEAQWIVRPWYRPRYHRAYYGYRNNYNNSMANLIRAQGQATLSYEQARGKYIENRLKWMQNYVKMKEERQAYDARQRELKKQSAHSPETLATAAKSDVPPALGADALDPVTGHITWPDILKGPDFSADRTRLDQLFELRATTSSGAMNMDKIHVATREMTEKLRNRIEELPTKHYIAARKFLDSLDYTAQNPAG